MLLLPTTTLLSWWITRRMAAETTTQRRRSLLVANILITLLPLLYFKYSGSFVSSISAMMGENLPVGKLFMPLGISFYTFQAISYTVDVYRRRFPATTPLLEYTFYLTFFPLLMAGPITRAEVLIPQEHADPLPPRGPLAYQGLWLILLGIVKKVIIADYIAQYNNWIFDTPTDYTGFECLMGVIGFSVQIFCDFSGYSDLAIGLAALMGFRLQDNFRFPYQATSLTEFWHRWHISLSTWFRDYVYIPLGGNRRGELRTYLNHLATMLIAGVWHGATGMFVVWGLLHGVGLVVNKFFHRHVFVQIPPSPAGLADNVWLCGLRVDLLPGALTHHGAPAAPPDLLRLLPDGVPPLPRRAPLVDGAHPGGPGAPHRPRARLSVAARSLRRLALAAEAPRGPRRRASGHQPQWHLGATVYL